MRLFCENDSYKLYQGNMLDLLEVIPENSIDSIVTDPPYELNFMNKAWDNSGIAFQKETWEKCLSVLKPGGYLLAFGGSRTFHRIACAIEDAGFEIRDTIMWLYGSGFPKSMNIGKCVESKLLNGSANVKDIKKLDGIKLNATGGWNTNEVEQGKRSQEYTQTKILVDYKTDEGKRWSNWGTGLKPSYEPIIVARKPCDDGCVNNVLKWGVGGINIEECRIGMEERTYGGMSKHKPGGAGTFRDDAWEPKDIEVTVNGRFPANVILSYDASDEWEVCGGFPDTVSSGGTGVASMTSGLTGNVYNGGWSHDVIADHLGGLGDSGSAARYFYCAKASKRDRDEGLDSFTEKKVTDGRKALVDVPFQRGESFRKNTHATVKPTSLMQYLVRLVTPNGGTILDPFNGSGSTGKAAMWENRDFDKQYKYIGIELSEEYLEISKARIEYAEHAEYIKIEEQKAEFKKEKPGQSLSMFDADDIF